MKLENFETALTYNDVLIVPKYSEIISRSGVDLSVSLTKEIKVDFPVLPANMANITGIEMMDTMYNIKAMSILHRFIPFEEQIKIFQNLKDKYKDDVFNYVGASIGVKREDYSNVSDLVNLGVKIIAIDVAHGDHKLCIDMTKFLSRTFPKIFVIAGTTATYYGAYRLFEAGADCVRQNVGAGSICLTRIESGVGMPQFTSVMEACRARDDFMQKKKKKVFVIADGGMTTVGCICKALCFADLALSGNMFAGTDETPGEKIEIDGKWYKNYEGSSTHKADRIEGVKGRVLYKGPIAGIVKRMREGIQSCCSYSGVNNLVDLKIDPQFVRITQAGLIESNYHDVILQHGENK